MENYWIDRRLKEGKHYPIALTRLIEAFKGKRFVIHKSKQGINKGPAFRQQEKEVREIEKMFVDYFLYQARMVKLEKYQVLITQANKDQWSLDKIQNLRKEYQTEWEKEFGTDNPGPTIERIIKAVNSRLKLANPQLLSKPIGQGHGFYLEPITITGTRRYFKRDRGETITYWELFARIIAGLNPRLVHRCAYKKCGKIYFSRQGKKFHSECRVKYFSEKYGKEGYNAERQKRYRLRKKKQGKARKHA